jgi:hypothetical protein
LGACHAVPCCVFPLASFKWCRALPTTVNWKFYLPALGVWLEAQRAAAAGKQCNRRCWPVGAAWESFGNAVERRWSHHEIILRISRCQAVSGRTIWLLPRAMGVSRRANEVSLQKRVETLLRLLRLSELPFPLYCQFADLMWSRWVMLFDGGDEHVLPPYVWAGKRRSLMGQNNCRGHP